VERALSNRGVVDTPKSGHGRTVDASSPLVDVLCELDARTKAAWLEQGLARGALKVAGLPPHFHIHCLRHTYASRLQAGGASPAYVQEQLGHASIELTVGTYGRWLRKRAPGAVDSLDAPIAAPSGSKVVADGAPEAEALRGLLPQVVESVPPEMVRPARFERATCRLVARPRGKPGGPKSRSVVAAETDGHGILGHISVSDTKPIAGSKVTAFPASCP
jgi:Phage integrase family